MVRGVCLGFFDVTLVFLLLCSVTGLLQMDQRRDAEDNQEHNKAILEMLHIDKVSASHQAKPHPYMKRIYQRLDALEAQDLGSSDGTLVQSFRSIVGKDLICFIAGIIFILPLSFNDCTILNCFIKTYLIMSSEVLQFPF